MKLRPITLALLGAGIGKGVVNVVKPISGFDRAIRIPTGPQNPEERFSIVMSLTEANRVWAALSIPKWTVPFRRQHYNNLGFAKVFYEGSS